jgi:hypothetical protein
MKANRKISDREQQTPDQSASNEHRAILGRICHGRTKAYEELRSGRLRGRKIGTRTIISQNDAEAWLQQLPALAVTKTTS